MKNAGWFVFGFLAIGVGLYPVSYFLFDMGGGLLASKSDALLHSVVWTGAFYTHIGFGAIAMLCGWTQFSRKIRNRNISLHRTLGKIYLVAVSLSGLAGLYLAFFATGGLVSSLGFGGLALAWVFTTSAAYKTIRQKEYDAHERWMIRSYALCFAAVTLRIWLPLGTALLQMPFVETYRVIAWLCWVPNLIVAEWIIARRFRKQPQTTALPA